MNRFAYREAQTVQEAVEMMRQEEGARIVAGATDVLIRWRLGVWKPRYVLNIKRIPGLDEVSYSPDTGLSLGTLVTAVDTMDLMMLTSFVIRDIRTPVFSA